MSKNQIQSAREKITASLKEYAKKHGAVKRDELFKPAIDSLSLSKKQLADKSSNGDYSKYRSLTGSIINELIKAGAIKLKTDEPQSKQSKTDTKTETIVTRRKAILDYLSEKYITDIEEKEKDKTAKINILKSIINDKNNEKEVVNLALSEAVDFIEKKFIKSAKIGIAVSKDINGEKFDFPNTLVGTCLRNHYEKYQKFLEKKLTNFDYVKSLLETIIEAIYSNGGAFLEKLSLDLVKAIYGQSVVPDSDKVTGGANDGGIDAELRITDKLGFEDKVVIQAKLSECGEKSIREFIGAMTFTSAQKGVFITASNISANTKNYVKSTSRTARRLMLIGQKELIEKMERFGVGILKDKYGNSAIDNKYFIIE